MSNQPTGNAPAQPVPQTAHYNPLPLKREEKLKIFAILSFRRDVPLDIIKDNKLSLNLTAAYSAGDAIMAARQSLSDMKLNQDHYKVPVMMIHVDADKIILTKFDGATFDGACKPKIEIQSKTEIPGKFIKAIEKSECAVRDAEMGEPTKNKKSTDEIVSYISYVFEKVGNDEEIKISKKVIKKFKAHAVKNKQPNL